MYPEYGAYGPVNLSRIRSATMMEVTSFLDLPTQLTLKQVSRYFRKLVKISHNSVSLDTTTGWVDAIHLSTFLRSIELAGHPKEEDLKEFTSLLRNDGFMQLESLGLFSIGETALLAILDALSSRLQREISLHILPSTFRASLAIQEDDFSPYFVRRFAALFHSGPLHSVLSSLRLSITSSSSSGMSSGVLTFFNNVQLHDCLHLEIINLNHNSLGRNGFEALAQSLWPLYSPASISPTSPTSPTSIPSSTPNSIAGSVSPSTSTTSSLRQLHLCNTGLTDSCLVSLSIAIEQGLLTTLEELDLSMNLLSSKGMSILSKPLSSFLLPNLQTLSLSDNQAIGQGALAPWLQALAKGVCPRLAVLRLNHCGLTELEITALGTFFMSAFAENMTQLDVGNNLEISPALPSFFHCLLKSPCHSLECLDFENVGMTSLEIRDLASWLQSPKSSHLHTLVLRVNAIDEQGLVVLLEALWKSPITALKLLDLSSNFLGDFSQLVWKRLFIRVKAISRTFLQIEELNIAHNPLWDLDFYLLLLFLKRCVDMHSLRCFCFEDNNITMEGLTNLFELFPSDESCQFQRFSVVSLNIRNVGRTLYSWLCLPCVLQLQKLHLVNCSLSRADLNYLLTALSTSPFCQGIRSIRLSGNTAVDDAFVKSFIAIYEKKGCLPHLFELDLSYTPITKVGAMAWVRFFEKHAEYTLRVLQLAYTDLSARRIEFLHRAFYRCFIGSCFM